MARIHADIASLAFPVDRLDLLPGNPRLGDVAAVARSYERFGQRKPIVAVRKGERGTVIAGNHQLLAARDSLGWPDIAVVWVDDDEATARAFALADNRTADLGSYDDENLLAMLQSVHAADADLFAATGFDELALADLESGLHAAENAGRDTEPTEPPAKPVTKLGDLIELGEHRLLCGDATERSDLERVLGGEDLSGAVLTDPPYGVAIGAKNRALDSIDRAGRVLTDLEGDRGIAEVEALWRGAFGAIAAAIPPGTPYYVFGPQGGELGLLLLLLRDSGLAPRHILIWAKNRPSFSIGRLDYDYQHEPVIYGWRPGAAHPWHADGTRQSILNFDRPAASKLHPTMKPVDLLEHLIGNSTATGEMVLDPFGGSGSTLIACENLGRRCRMLELDPAYADVIVDRWERHTGRKAKRPRRTKRAAARKGSAARVAA